MTPIVFCASLPPWLIEYAADEAKCSALKVLLARLGCAFLNRMLVSNISSIAMAKPSIGETTMATIVLVVPELSTAPNPACAMPAPSNPPTSAWLDEDGRPLTQVNTFQTIAPTRAPKTTAGVTISLSIIPEPTVSATWSPTIQ